MQASASLRLERVSLSRSGRELFSALDLQLKPGELTLIQGDTGCGKSSLLQLMAGLIRPTAGQVAADGRIALILQDPDLQLIRDQVGPEVALLLEQLGQPASGMPERVATALEQVGLNLSQMQQVRELSLGQRYRLLIAGQLVDTPDVLLLDEPWAQLDDEGFCQLQALLQNLLAQRISVVITEHRPKVWKALADHHLYLDAQGLKPVVPDSLFTEQSGLYPPFSWPAGSAISAAVGDSAPLLKSDAFELELNPGQSLYGRSLTLMPGTLVQLTGSNGSGKSSFVDLLLGIRKLKSGHLLCLGKKPEAQYCDGQLGFVLQHPARQIFADTVKEEIAFSLLRAGCKPDDAELQVTQMLTDLQLEALAERSPYTLSYGQQHLVAIAAQAILKPRLLILDDPSAGLDARSLQALSMLLKQLLAEGCGVLITGHRVFPGGDAHWQIQSGQIQGGRIVERSAGENALSSSVLYSATLSSTDRLPSSPSSSPELTLKQTPQQSPKASGWQAAKSRFLLTVSEANRVRFKLLLTPLLVAACFMLPVAGLLALGCVLSLLVIRQPEGGKNWLRLFRLMSLQFGLLCLFYLLRFGWQSWPEALLVSARLFLAFLPGLWFFLSTQAHQLVLALRPLMSARSALVLSATLALIPRLTRESQQLYQLQILRGARISLSHFWRLSGWQDLLSTVLQPLLIQLIRLTWQQALAMKSRGYQGNRRPTCYPPFSQQRPMTGCAHTADSPSKTITEISS